MHRSPASNADIINYRTGNPLLFLTCTLSPAFGGINTNIGTMYVNEMKIKDDLFYEVPLEFAETQINNVQLIAHVSSVAAPSRKMTDSLKPHLNGLNTQRGG